MKLLHVCALPKCVRQGCNRDFPTYLVESGSADILFPSDFRALAALYRGVAGAEAMGEGWTDHGTATWKDTQRGSARLPAVQILKSKAFFEAYAGGAATICRNGYNPLLEDFSNTSFLLGV